MNKIQELIWRYNRDFVVPLVGTLALIIASGSWLVYSLLPLTTDYVCEKTDKFVGVDGTLTVLRDGRHDSRGCVDVYGVGDLDIGNAERFGRWQDANYKNDQLESRRDEWPWAVSLLLSILFFSWLVWKGYIEHHYYRLLLRRPSRFDKKIERYSQRIREEPKYRLFAFEARAATYSRIFMTEEAKRERDKARWLLSVIEDSSAKREREKARWLLSVVGESTDVCMIQAPLRPPEIPYETLNDAVKIDPDNAVVYLNRGNAYYAVKRYKQAINDYDHAIRLNPQDAEPHFNRGQAYYSLCRYQRAVKDFNKAIRLDPEHGDAYFHRGLAYDELLQFQQALESFNETIRRNPDYGRAYFNRGRVYLMLKQHNKSQADYRKAKELGYPVPPLILS